MPNSSTATPQIEPDFKGSKRQRGQRTKRAQDPSKLLTVRVSDRYLTWPVPGNNIASVPSIPSNDSAHLSSTKHADTLLQARAALLFKLDQANDREPTFRVRPRRPYDAILTRINPMTGYLKTGENLNRSRVSRRQINEANADIIQRRTSGNQGRPYPPQEPHSSLSLHIKDPQPKSRLKCHMVRRMAQASLHAYELSKQYGWDIIQHEQYHTEQQHRGAVEVPIQEYKTAPQPGSPLAQELAMSLVFLKKSFPNDFPAVTINPQAVDFAINGPTRSNTVARAPNTHSNSVRGVQFRPLYGGTTDEANTEISSTPSSSSSSSQANPEATNRPRRITLLKTAAGSKTASLFNRLADKVHSLSQKLNKRKPTFTVVDPSTESEDDDDEEEDSDDEYAELEDAWRQHRRNQISIANWLDAIIADEHANLASATSSIAGGDVDVDVEGTGSAISHADEPESPPSMSVSVSKTAADAENTASGAHWATTAETKLKPNSKSRQVSIRNAVCKIKEFLLFSVLCASISEVESRCHTTTTTTTTTNTETKTASAVKERKAS